MPDPHWGNLNEIFHAAIALKGKDRAVYLERACSGDDSLRKQVESLIKSHEETGNFVDAPAYQAAAQVLRESGELKAGQTVGHYRIFSLLGEGGMGKVYLAEDTKLHRRVSLKFLSTSFTEDQQRLRRFEQEARAVSALNHPNILTIHEIGEEGGHRFIVTEFIEGQTLREQLRSGLEIEEALEIAIQVASALVAAHRVNIVHRDIKPENLMIRKEDGLVKVLDFGLAKVTRTTSSGLDSEVDTKLMANTGPGVVMGTVAYMSPEQARGETVDERTDIWSLGVVVYEMVAGCSPFIADTSNEIISAILSKQATPPLARYSRLVPERLEEIVEKSLTKNREERYQTSKDLLIDLKRLKQSLELKAGLERAPSGAGIASSAFPQETAGGAKRETLKTQHTFSQRIGNRNLLIGFTAALLVAAIGFGYWFFANRAVNLKQIESIVVLPFINASGNAEAEFLSDGISESLMNSLSQLPQLRVIDRNSSFKYKGKDYDPDEVASTLDVQTILSGRVLSSGNNLVINVNLMDTRDKRQIWGGQFNHKATDLLTVQSEISKQIADQLRARLTETERQQVAKLETENPAAYELRLKANFYRHKGGMEGFKKAVAFREEAIAIDPNYALAYAELSMGYTTLINYSIVDPKEYLPKAEGAAKKALELDAGLAEAHMALAETRQFSWDWTSAEREVKRAIELNPNLVGAHVRYARYLSFAGRHDEAITEIMQAKRLDPINPNVNSQIGLVLYMARRHEAALEALQKSLELDEKLTFTHLVFGYNYAAMGRWREAVAAYQETIRLGDDSPSTQIYLGAAYAGMGEKKRAEAILKQLETSKEYVSPGELANLYVALGENEKAFASLEKAFAARDLQLQYLGESTFDPLRSDPRFQGLIKRVGLYGRTEP